MMHSHIDTTDGNTIYTKVLILVVMDDALAQLVMQQL